MTEQPTKSVELTENQLIALGRTVGFWLEAHSGMPLAAESDEVQTLMELVDIVDILARALGIEKPSVNVMKMDVIQRKGKRHGGHLN